MKYTIIYVLVFLMNSFVSISQEISIKDQIAYIDGVEYFKIEQIRKRKFNIKQPKTNVELLKVVLFRSYNVHDRKSYKLPRLIFRDQQTLEFGIKIEKPLDFVKLLYEHKIILPHGILNKKAIHLKP